MNHPSLRCASLLTLALAAFLPPSFAQRSRPVAPIPGPTPVALEEWEETKQAARFYFREPVTGTFVGANPAQGIEGRITGSSIAVGPLDPAPGTTPWSLVLKTQGFGRKGYVTPLGAAEASAKHNRVDVLHGGGFSTWYVNDPRGIEQGWTIAAPPDGDPGRPLWISLAVEGDLTLVLPPGGESGLFLDARGVTCVSYRDLAAWDAEGTPLAAAIVSGPEGLGIRVDDAGAVYPLTVDPLLAGPVWTAAGSQAFEHLGSSVSSAGDVNGDGFSDVVVGSPRYDGAYTNGGRAQVFAGSPAAVQASPLWSVEGEQAGARFGDAVALAGDVNGDGYGDVIVGASRYTGPAVASGRAYVYFGSSAGPATTAAWSYDGGGACSFLGTSVSTAGDVNGDGYADVIVGAPGDQHKGTAFVFHGSASGLSTTPDWSFTGSLARSGLGDAVSAAGDVDDDGYDDVIVGACRHGSESGRAHVFLGSAAGLAASPVWTRNGVQAGDRYGAAVAGAGDVNDDGYADVLVGVPGFDGAQPDAGRAYLYLGGMGGPATTAAWMAEGNALGASFGEALATAGDVDADGRADVIVGSPGAGSTVNLGVGKVEVFRGVNSGLEDESSWFALGDDDGGRFGDSVGFAGDVDGDGIGDVIAGEPRGTGIFGYEEQGFARVFLGTGEALETTLLERAPIWNTGPRPGGFMSAMLGVSAAGAGDIDANGHADVIVGGPEYGADLGVASTYLGSALGLPPTPNRSYIGARPGVRLGTSVAGAGDVDGDGYPDVVIGVPSPANPFYPQTIGSVLVFGGSAAGLPASPAWTLDGEANGNEFGASVAGAGDVNGDGFADLIVGAPERNFARGRAYVYLGSASGLASSPIWKVNGLGSGDRFGASVACAGDVNGDGYDDVIVGAPDAGGAKQGQGTAFVYLGSASGPAATPIWSAAGGQVLARFGTSVATAGDVNGDGYDDVLVGAPRYDAGEMDEGRAYAYLGSAAGPGNTPSWVVEGDQTRARLGRSVSALGDADGDGYGDVVVGAPGLDNPLVQKGGGQVRAYAGSASGLSTTATWTADGFQNNSFFGRSVASAGDVNGDGSSDLIVGASRFNTILLRDVGRAYVFLGIPAVAPLTQWNVAGTAPIAVGGRSPAPDAFRIRLEVRAGGLPASWVAPRPVTAWLEWEIVRTGETFGAGTRGRSPVGLPYARGTTLSFDELVTGLDPGTAYQWRARIVTDHPLCSKMRWRWIGGSLSGVKVRTAPWPPRGPAIGLPGIPEGGRTP